MVGQREGGLYLVTRPRGFPPSLPTPSGSRPTPCELAGALLSGRRKTFKAMGRHLCRAQMAASVPASSLHSSGVKCS